MSQHRGSGKSTKGASSSNTTRSLSRWSPAEDRALISSMSDLIDIGGWKADNGQFKSGSYGKLEELIVKKLPATDKKAKPHIESRVKILRKQFDAITDMLNASGFGWNDKEKFVTCASKVWDEWLKSHPNAHGMRMKPFPYYDDLSKIWGKYRATGNEAANVNELLEEMESGARGEEDQVTDITADEINSSSQFNQTEPPVSTPQSSTPSSNRTKKARTETVEALNLLSANFAKVTEVMEAATGHIGRLVDCFQHEADSANNRKLVATVIEEMGCFQTHEVLTVVRKIARES